ncbi:unnamed protein product, partial [Allacma fusca]
DLDFLREKRDNYLLESTGNDESEHESNINKRNESGSNKPTSSPQSSSDESTSENDSPKLKRSKVTLPQAPVFVPNPEILNLDSIAGISGENQPLFVDFPDELSHQNENNSIILSTNSEVSKHLLAERSGWCLAYYYLHKCFTDECFNYHWEFLNKCEVALI